MCYNVCDWSEVEGRRGGGRERERERESESEMT